MELEREGETMKKPIPLYMQSIRYAKEHGQLEQYRRSYQETIACKEAIEAAISRHYVEHHLRAEAAEEVLEHFEPDRILMILAHTIRASERDGRFSRENRAWAKTLPVCDTWDQDVLLEHSHPGLVDVFLTQVRERYAQSQKSDLRFQAMQKPPVLQEAGQEAQEPEKGPER